MAQQQTWQRPPYRAEDLETASIRSGAPSYVSEAPSYHSNRSIPESIPAYTPQTVPSFAATLPRSLINSRGRHQSGGLPPVPRAPCVSVPNLHNYRLPAWSANDALAARHYHNVAERRVTEARWVDNERHSPERQKKDDEEQAEELRPLEDPYLVGEVAAAKARRERIARETGEDILIQEDRQWDWLLEQMKDWDTRERNWKQFQRQVSYRHGKNLLRRIGGSRTNGFLS